MYKLVYNRSVFIRYIHKIYPTHTHIYPHIFNTYVTHQHSHTYTDTQHRTQSGNNSSWNTYTHSNPTLHSQSPYPYYIPTLHAPRLHPTTHSYNCTPPHNTPYPHKVATPLVGILTHPHPTPHPHTQYHTPIPVKWQYQYPAYIRSPTHHNPTPTSTSTPHPHTYTYIYTPSPHLHPTPHLHPIHTYPHKVAVLVAGILTLTPSHTSTLHAPHMQPHTYTPHPHAYTPSTHLPPQSGNTSSGHTYVRPGVTRSSCVRHVRVEV